jgi:hypothetical protein
MILPRVFAERELAEIRVVGQFEIRPNESGVML